MAPVDELTGEDAERALHAAMAKQRKINDARADRAWRMYHYCARNGITRQEVELFTADEWLHLGREAGLNPDNPMPHAETRGRLIGYMTDRPD